MSVRRILVVDTMGGLGDLLLALPMLHGLARTHPRAELRVVTTAPWHVLLDRDPLVAHVTPVPDRDEGTVRRVVAEALEVGRPDLAVTTNRQFGLPELLEREAEHAVTNLWRGPPADELVDVRYARLLARDGWLEQRYVDEPPRVALDEAEVAEGSERLLRLAGGARPVLLFPDSGMAVKRWPVRSWRELARRIAADGRVPVTVTESAALAEALAAAGATVAPPLRLRELAALAAAAARAGGTGVGGDTGPVRLASAVGLPCAGLYGATVAPRYGLREPANRNVQGWAACPERTPTAITEQVCWWSAECPFTADESLRCMSDIRPVAVLEALAALRP